MKSTRLRESRLRAAFPLDGRMWLLRQKLLPSSLSFYADHLATAAGGATGGPCHRPCLAEHTSFQVLLAGCGEFSHRCFLVPSAAATGRRWHMSTSGLGGSPTSRWRIAGNIAKLLEPAARD